MKNHKIITIFACVVTLASVLFLTSCKNDPIEIIDPEPGPEIPVKITLVCNPKNGGTTSGDSTYYVGTQCTVKAKANAGYRFINWTENGAQVSSQPDYTFKVTEERTLVANFTKQDFKITVSVDPEGSGTATGNGTYHYDETCTVTATANDDCTFTNWTENGELVTGAGATYSFAVHGNRNLVAHFSQQAYTISVGAEPSDGGTVTGSGTYGQGQSCTLHAIPNPGFTFFKWTENGNQVSTSADYTFNVSSNRNLTAHFRLVSYTINVSANPSNGGTVNGGGSYTYNQTCTITAAPATGFAFVNWTENGIQVSTNPTYTFQVTNSAIYVAHFRVDSYSINVSANPSNGGIVSGGGNYTHNQTCTISATPATGFVFLKWTKNGIQISTNPTYTFQVTNTETYVAHFHETPQAPIGAIDGLFSVGNSKWVFFSQGNLQYKASTDTWRFAENQLDCKRLENVNVSPSYNDWIDLFCWGTSGYNHGAVCYRPWSTSENPADYYAYGNYNYNLYDMSKKADWGCNAISNAGNISDQWRTLTADEWSFLLFYRNTPSGVRFAKAIISEVVGLLILPDNWDSSLYVLHNTNNTSVNYSSNCITKEDWTFIIEQNGGVFLPAGSYRNGTVVENSNPFKGYYWSSTHANQNQAKNIEFNNNQLFSNDSPRNYGLNVRLVQEVYFSKYH